MTELGPGTDIFTKTLHRRGVAYRRFATFAGPVKDLSRRRSLDASASSQSRNVAIFGSDAVALGQTIQ